MRKPVVLRADVVTAASGGLMVVGRPDITVTGVSIDSRRITPGDLFIAIRGHRFDGHRFTGEALQNGAVGLVVSDLTAVPATAEKTGSLFVIEVDDTVRALQLLGQYVRRESGARVVAITGSVGKTTTKELIAAVLAPRFDVFRTRGNLNNHIGLPLSLLELRRCPDIAVVELGMNHAGEIRTLVGLAEPDIRVWTNVAEVHAEFFASVDAIADAKAEILDMADADTELVANAGDARVVKRIAGFPGRVTTFGVDTQADVSATHVEHLGLDGMAATVHTPTGSRPIRTPLLGEGNVANVLAAVAVALRCQVPLDDVLSRVATFAAQSRRGEVLRLGHITVVDDSYNSNPIALERALVSVGHDSALRRVAVVGEMLELGSRSEALHRQCGQVVAAAGFDVLIAVGGAPVRALADSAIAAGLAPALVSTFASSEAAADRVLAIVRDGDVVLVKGSRGVRTDRVVERLKSGHR